MFHDLAAFDLRFVPSQLLRPGEIVVIADDRTTYYAAPDALGVEIARTRQGFVVAYDSKTFTDAEARGAFVEALNRSARHTERQTPNGHADAGHA